MQTQQARFSLFHKCDHDILRAIVHARRWCCFFSPVSVHVSAVRCPVLRQDVMLSGFGCDVHHLLQDCLGPVPRVHRSTRLP
eukprot:1147172-Rhodomonas_salina.1